MLLTNMLLLQIHGIIDQNSMPSVCMESLLPLLYEWAIYENLVAVCS